MTDESVQILGCAFCDTKGHSKSAINAHLRRYVPELLPHTMFRKVRTSPAHPVELCREYLRGHCLKKWSQLLNPPTSEKPSPAYKVLEAFAKFAAVPADGYPQDWADRDYAAVRNEHWDKMVAQVLKDFVAHRNPVTMEADVKKVVMDAIASTFTPEDEEEEEDVQDDGAINNGNGNENVNDNMSIEDLSDGIELDNSRDEISDDEPIAATQRQRRRALIDNHPSTMNKSGRDWTSSEINGTGHNIKTGTNHVFLSNAAKAFENFPLMMIVVKMFGSTINLPAHYNTPLAKLIADAQAHKGNPLGGHKVRGGFRGVGAWNGIWDEGLWGKVKLEAKDLEGEMWAGNPTCMVYHVEFVVMQEPVMID